MSKPKKPELSTKEWVEAILTPECFMEDDYPQEPLKSTREPYDDS